MQARGNLTGTPKSKVVQFFALAPVLVAAGLALSGAAAAADEIFLRLDGIMGSSTAVGHQNEIVVTTYSQAFSNSVSTATGSGSGAGKVNCGEITVMKNIDTSSPKLIGAVVTGTHIATGDIKLDSTRANGLVETYHVALTDVLVTDIAQMDRTPQGVMEQVKLSASQFKFTFTPIANTGGPGTPISFSVDCRTNVVN